LILPESQRQPKSVSPGLGRQSTSQSIRDDREVGQRDRGRAGPEDHMAKGSVQDYFLLQCSGGRDKETFDKADPFSLPAALQDRPQLGTQHFVLSSPEMSIFVLEKSDLSAML